MEDEQFQRNLELRHEKIAKLQFEEREEERAKVGKLEGMPRARIESNAPDTTLNSKQGASAGGKGKKEDSKSKSCDKGKGGGDDEELCPESVEFLSRPADHRNSAASESMVPTSSEPEVPSSGATAAAETGPLHRPGAGRRGR